MLKLFKPFGIVAFSMAPSGSYNPSVISEHDDQEAAETEFIRGGYDHYHIACVGFEIVKQGPGVTVARLDGSPFHLPDKPPISPSGSLIEPGAHYAIEQAIGFLNCGMISNERGLRIKVQQALDLLNMLPIRKRDKHHG